MVLRSQVAKTGMAALLASLLAACATTPQPSTLASAPQSQTTSPSPGDHPWPKEVPPSDAPLGAPAAFPVDWLNALKADAVRAQIPYDLVDEAFLGLTPDPRIIELDRKQPEYSLPFLTYTSERINAQRVESGRAALAANKSLLDEVSSRYGVPAGVIVAIWGMETNYGRFTGRSDVLRSLATLAFDGRRSAYFRGELLAFLKLVHEENINPAQMKGSWAGAMGQVQFMPSSYRNFAADHNGDGKRDIWATDSDVFASIANYFRAAGWIPGQPWGVEVTLPQGFAARKAALMPETPPTSCQRALLSHTKALYGSEWSALGLTSLDGQPLPAFSVPLSLVEPDTASGRAFLVTPNFRSVLKYNCSNYYALAVALLADQLEMQP